jgi:3-oxoacyl-[acyl-carrier protein] reductase
VVSAAGTDAWGTLSDVTAEACEKVIMVNLVGTAAVVRASLPFLVESEGRIVTVASTLGLRALSDATAYCASKFALHGMTECWRAELRQHNVRVMQVNPSEVQTSFGADESKPVKAENPSKLTSSDIAELVVTMLALEDHGFITEATMWATNPH